MLIWRILKGMTNIDVAVAIDAAVEDIRNELDSAMGKWPPFNSAHEGIAVVLEEFEELWEHVKVNQNKRDIDAMRKEAIQLAAMAARFAIEVTGEVARK
jgi:hypothetical protein